MDTSRFDSLTRSLTDARSRRGTLAALVGGTLGLLGLTDTAATKRTQAHDEGKHKKKKKKRPTTTTPAPVSPPPPTPFCVVNPGSRACQASGPQCICAQDASGAPACVVLATWRNTTNCGQCTGPGEMCMYRGDGYGACAVPCANHL